MDIGTLTGEIAIEDQLSGTLEMISHKVEQFSADFVESFGPMAIGVTAVTVAITGATAAITALASRGSDVNDVAGNLENFAGSGARAKDIIEAMGAGTKNTVDDFVLMKDASKLLSVGALQNADDFKSLTEAAFVLQNRGLGTTEQMLGTLSQALVTGRTRSLQMMVGVIDTKGAEEQYAASLGKTVSQLTSAEKVHADRIAIMNKARSVVEESGVAERDFGEQIEAASTWVKNWIDELASAVAASPAVNRAVAEIGKGLEEVFGGDQTHRIETIVGWVDSFANAVTAIVDPTVKVINVATTLIGIWWEYKDVISGLIAAYVLYEISQGNLLIQIGVLSLDLGELTFATVAQKIAALATTEATGLWTLATTTLMGGLSKLWAVMLANPITATIALIGALVVAYTKWAEHSANVELAQKTQEAQQFSINKAIKDGILNLDEFRGKQISYADAVKYNNEHSIKLGTTLVNLKTAIATVGDDTYSTTEKVKVLTSSVMAAAKNGTLTSASMAQVATALKDAGIKAEDLTPELANIVKGQQIVATTAAEAAAAEEKHKKQLEATAKAAEDHAKAVDKANQKLADYGRSLTPLTAAEQARVISLHKATLTTEDIVAITGLAAQSVETLTNKYKDNIKWLDGLKNKAIELKTALPANMLSTLGGGAPIELAGGAEELSNLGTALAKPAELAIPVWSELFETHVNPGFKRLKTNLEAMNPALAKFHEEGESTLSVLASGFQRLGQAAGGSLGGIISDVGQMVTVLDNAAKAQEKAGVEGGWGYGSILTSKAATGKEKLGAGIAGAASIAQGIQDIMSAESPMESTMAGAKAGSAFGAIGAAIGAAGGLVAGLIKGKPAWKKASDEISRDLGVSISEELGKKIAESAKEMGGRQGAILANLSGVIEEAGGLTDSNLGKFTSKLHDVFSMIDTGQMSIAQGTKVINENWATFVDAGTSAYGVLNKDLVDIIKLNDQFGTESKAILDYLGQQGAAGAQHFGNAVTIGADALTRQKEIMAEMGTASAEDLKRLNEELLVQQGIIDATTIKSQAGADAMAAAVAADFDAMLNSGMSFSQAVAAIQPAIEGLQTQMEAAGLSGSAVFEALQGQVALYSDAVAGPALTAVDELTQGLVNLDNMGKGNQETFMALTAQIGVTFDSLVAQGKSGDEVMIAMRDSLQRVWEEEQQFGYVADETTQALVDQAVQQGLVGETHKSVTQQMLDASNRMVDVLTAMAKVMGADLPSAAQTGASGVQKALNSISAPKLTIDVGFDDHGGYRANVEAPEPGDVSYASTGGLVTASGVQYLAGGGNVLPFEPRGTDTVPAMLTPGERVLSVEQNQNFEQNFTGPTNQDVVDAVNGLRLDMTSKMPRALARSLHAGLADLRTAS